jgi:hypothetical protein
MVASVACGTALYDAREGPLRIGKMSLFVLGQTGALSVLAFVLAS